MIRRPHLSRRLRIALAVAGVIAALAAWTAAASAVFLWGSGLLRFFPLNGTAWWWQWWAYALHAPPHPVVSRWLTIGGAVPAVLAGLVAWRLRGLRGSTAVKPGGIVRGSTDNHGHAEWMSMAEARRRLPADAGDCGGVVVGEAYRVDQDTVAGVPFDPARRATWGQGGHAPLLVDPCTVGPTHSLVFAGSGGFKTVMAASTLARWRGSVVVLDPSRELGPMLAAVRGNLGQKVVALEPGKPGGVDVLGWINTAHPLAETNVHAVVGWICGEAEPGGNDTDGFFRSWGKQLVACLLADMLWDAKLPPDRRTLRELRSRVVTPEDEMRKLLERIHAGPGASASPMARDLAGSLKKMVAETFSGIYGNANGETAWLSVAAYADLVSGGAPGSKPSCAVSEVTGGDLSVFLQLPLKVLRDTPAIGRVLVGAFTNALYEADGAVRGRVLFLLDEVARLGRMKILETARDAGRKYGITLQLLYQAEDQLAAQWGPQGRGAWFNSVSWRSYSAIQDGDTAEAVSKAAGGHSVMAESEGDNRGSSGKPLETGSRSAGSSTNRHEIARPLIRADELLHDMRGDEAVVFLRGARPLRCGRAIYFRRPELRDAIEASRFHKQAAE